MEFNIGERVRIRAYEDMPESIRNGWIAKKQGKDGEIVDKLWSAAMDQMVYCIRFAGVATPSRTFFAEGTFDRISDLIPKVTYVYEFDNLEKVVVARFYEVDEDGKKTEIARGHGHLIHEGALGIAQASAFALKRIWKDLEDN
jgi:hypothetical protein